MAYSIFKWGTNIIGCIFGMFPFLFFPSPGTFDLYAQIYLYTLTLLLIQNALYFWLNREVRVYL